MANTGRKSKSEYMTTGILFLVAWSFVAYFLFNELKDKDGLLYIVSSIKEGNYFPMLLVAFSIILFAFALKNIFSFFKPGIDDQ